MWLHSLKVAQLLRSADCLHTNQSRSYLNHLIYICVCVCVCVSLTFLYASLPYAAGNGFSKMLCSGCKISCFLNMAGFKTSFILTTSRSTILAQRHVAVFSKSRNKPSCSITNPMEHETDMPSSPQVISYLLRKAILCYQVLECPSLEPILRRMTPGHTPTLTSVLIFSLMMVLSCNCSAISE